MSEADEVAKGIFEMRKKVGLNATQPPATLEDATEIVRIYMPNETSTVINAVGEAFWEMF